SFIWAENGVGGCEGRMPGATRQATGGVYPLGVLWRDDRRYQEARPASQPHPRGADARPAEDDRQRGLLHGHHHAVARHPEVAREPQQAHRREPPANPRHGHVRRRGRAEGSRDRRAAQGVRTQQQQGRQVMTDHDDTRTVPAENAGDSHAEHDAHAGHDMHGHDAHAGHDHSAHDPAMFKRKFWLSLVLTIPTLVFSRGLQDILGLGGPRFPGSDYIPAAFGVVLMVYGGWVFIKGGISEVRAKQPGMMTLISLAIIVAFGYSAAVTLGVHGMDFWWELSTLITIMLLGHWIEMSAIMGAQNALGELAKLLPDEAELLQDDGEATTTVPVARLRRGDRVLVRPGAAIPVDGEIVDGESEVNESLLTGESSAVAKVVGARVIAGSINGSGALAVRVTETGDTTALAGIMKLVADAQQSRSGSQVLADRAAALLFYVAVAAAVVTLLVWFLLKPDDPG